MANLKNITDLPMAESTEGLNLIVNDNGAAKQIAADKVGRVKSVNGAEPDDNGNVEIEIPEEFSGSWNDLIDRPFYAEEPVEVEIVPEVTIEKNSFETPVAPYSNSLQIGDKCIVLYNGTTYECIGFDFEGMVAFGNVEIVNGANSGVPFLLINIPGKCLLLLSNDESPEITLSIKALVTPVHYLDSKYIKDMYHEYMVPNTDVVMWEQTVTTENDYAFVDSDNMSVYQFLTEGATYIVTWNGTEYTCVARYDNWGGLYIGNQAIAIETDGVSFPESIISNEPFFFCTYEQDDDYGLIVQNAGEHTISILGTGEKLTPRKIDMKYIPYEIVDGLEYLSGEINDLYENRMRNYNPYGTGRFSLNRKSSTSEGQYSFAEGFDGTASGKYSHAEGNTTTASGESSHAEGYNTTASGDYSHTEGYNTNASGSASHVEGCNTKTTAGYSHAEGYHTTASGESSHAEGGNTTASKNYSHAEGYKTEASANCAHAEGNYTKAIGGGSHAEGNWTEASGTDSHAEGLNAVASGYASHAEGNDTEASGADSHAEGSQSIASGHHSHAEGNDTEASGENSHAEGHETKATGARSHAEGYNTTASGWASHAEGLYAKASGESSHAEGSYTNAIALNSHAEGNWTIASGEHSHVQGQYNIEDSSSTYAHIVGNGASDENRSNAHTLDWDGNAWYQGDVYVGSTSGTNKDEGSKKLATEEYVDNALNQLPEQIQSDWNQTNENAPDYIKNKPFYTTAVDGEVILPERQDYYHKNESYYDITPQLSLEAGKTYKCIIDGTVYECVAYETMYSTGPIVAIGNATRLSYGIVAPPETINLPFFVYNSGTKSSIYVKSGTHTIFIIAVNEEVKTLDEKYIPESVKPKVSFVNIDDLYTQFPFLGDIDTEDYQNEALSNTKFANIITAEVFDEMYAYFSQGKLYNSGGCADSHIDKDSEGKLVEYSYYNFSYDKRDATRVVFGIQYVYFKLFKYNDNTMTLSTLYSESSIDLTPNY